MSAYPGTPGSRQEWFDEPGLSYLGRAHHENRRSARERGATLITSNLPFDEWTETLGSERLTGALPDRITHHVNILETNGDSYRRARSRARKAG